VHLVGCFHSCITMHGIVNVAYIISRLGGFAAMISSYDDLADGQKVVPLEPGVLTVSQELCVLYGGGDFL